MNIENGNGISRTVTAHLTVINGLNLYFYGGSYGVLADVNLIESSGKG